MEELECVKRKKEHLEVGWQNSKFNSHAEAWVTRETSYK
jgi:hypothetical protein